MEILNNYPKGSTVYEKIVSAMGSFNVFSDRRLSERLIGSGKISLRKYSSGEQIFGRNNFERALGIIVSGSAVVKKEDKQNSVELKRIGVGGLFGAAALFSENDEYTSEIIAKGKETLVAFVDQNAVREILVSDPDAAMKYIYFLTDRIRYLNGKIYCFTGTDAISKVKLYLKDNAESEILASALARALDIGRTSLYRALTKLEVDGLIIKEGKRIRVINKEALF